MLSTFMNFIENVIFKCWWMILFTLVCGIFYEKGRKKIDDDYQKLFRQLTELQAIKKEKLFIQEELTLKVNSQSDPDFVELLLMKELGVIPEGHQKFFFKR